MALTTNVPSDRFEDLQRDVQDATRFPNATVDYQNRIGQTITPLPLLQEQINTSIQETGWFAAAGSFEAGGTVTARNQYLQLITTAGSDVAGGYTWGGTLPKIVPPGSAPATTGGQSANTWVYRGETTVRADFDNFKDALESDTGSQLVTFKRSATATAVAKSLEEYLTSISIDVSQFGSPVAGVWNADVIQKAINVAEALTGPTEQLRTSGAQVNIPNGLYAADVPLIIRRRGLVLNFESRGAVLYPSASFAGIALIQSRATEDRSNSISINFVIQNGSLWGIDPVAGDLAAPSAVKGLTLSSMDAQTGPLAIKNVAFRNLSQCINGQRLYGLRVEGCSFMGGTSSFGERFGDAMVFDSTFADTVDTGGVRAVYIGNNQFCFLHRAIISRFSYGCEFRGNRLEQNDPSASGDGADFQGLLVIRDGRGWDVSGANYFEATLGHLFILGYAPNIADAAQGVNIKNNYIQETSTTYSTWVVEDAAGCTIAENHIRDTVGRSDFTFKTGGNYTGNTFEYKNSVAGTSFVSLATNELKVYQQIQPSPYATNYNDANISGQSSPATKSVELAFNSSASGARSKCVAVNNCETTGANSVVACSTRTLNNEANVLVMGGDAGAVPALSNRRIRLSAISGNITYTGSLLTTFADYAELVENGEGVEIPLGNLITIKAGKAYKASSGDSVDGVVSGTAAILLNDSPFAWSKRYLTGEFGEKLYHEIPDPDYDGEGDAPLVKRQIENPDFDISADNIPRSERPDEWTTVGMIGQMYARVDADVAADDFIKSGNSGVGAKSDIETRIKVMRITQDFDSDKGYAVAYCLRS